MEDVGPTGLGERYVDRLWFRIRKFFLRDKSDDRMSCFMQGSDFSVPGSIQARMQGYL